MPLRRRRDGASDPGAHRGGQATFVRVWVPARRKHLDSFDEPSFREASRRRVLACAASRETNPEFATSRAGDSGAGVAEKGGAQRRSTARRTSFAYFDPRPALHAQWNAAHASRCVRVAARGRPAAATQRGGRRNRHPLVPDMSGVQAPLAREVGTGSPGVPARRYGCRSRRAAPRSREA